MKKLLALLLAAVMVFGCVSAFADEGSEPDWSGYDARIAEIKATTDFAAREKLLHEAEDELMATGAIVPIYYYNDVYMAKEGLTGYYSNAYATKFFMYADFGENTTLRLQLASEPQPTASADCTPMTPTANWLPTLLPAMKSAKTA